MLATIDLGSMVEDNIMYNFGARYCHARTLKAEEPL